MKKQLLVFIFAVFCSMAWGQVAVTPKVIASTGKFATAGQTQVCYTVGELAAITTAGNIAGVHVTQGFHQPEELIGVGLLDDQKEAPLNFVVYPNPAANTLWLGYEMTEPGKAQITVTDINGKAISTLTKESYINGKSIEHFDVSKLGSGTYLLNLQFTTAAGKQYLSTKSFSINH